MGDMSTQGRESRKRICVISMRSQNNHVSRCSDYEFEDVITSVDDADLFTIEQGRSFSLRKRMVNQSTRHVSSVFAHVSPSFSRFSLEKSYDLFIAVFEDITDLLVVNSIQNWEQQCKYSVCWIDEIWLASLEVNRSLCENILSKFDFIFTGCQGSVKRLQEIVHKPCCYIPPGVDMLKFIPKASAPERDIDIYSMGRRPNILHQKLLALKESKGITYRYDGLSSSALYVKDYRVHRDNLRESLQKSRSFLVFPSKFDVLNQTHGQVEFGFRFFEGAASGTVLIGDIPDSETFKEIFHWEDAVIPLPDNTDDLYRMLGTLDESKERVERIRKNNIYQCLMHHDWAYRWRQILESVGLEVTLSLQEREQRLKKMSAHYVTG